LRPAPDPLVRGSEADARRAAQGYAEQVAAFAGNVPLTRATTSVGACPQRGDAFAGRGSAELTVPAEGHGPLLARMRDGWRAQGYQVTAAPGGRAVLSVELPPAGPVFTLASMAPRGTVVLLVRTPCLRR
jgi:hypothetical protein